jgi:putative endonuclease
MEFSKDGAATSPLGRVCNSAISETIWPEVICVTRLAGPQWLAMHWATEMRAECLERTLSGLDSVAARRGRADGLPAHLLTGIKGEEEACFHLLRKGYTVVARRWSSGNQPGDLDLIAWQGPMLCLFEVKTRTVRDLTPAETAVDLHKRNVLRRLARQYVRQLPGGPAVQVRFDVISVYLEPGKESEFVHFENAFGWREVRGRE